MSGHPLVEVGALVVWDRDGTGEGSAFVEVRGWEGVRREGFDGWVGCSGGEGVGEVDLRVVEVDLGAGGEGKGVGEVDMGTGGEVGV